MILETVILAGLAKLGCIVTAVKITKRKKQTGEVAKKEKSRRAKRKRLSQARPGNPEKINVWDRIR